MTILMKRHITLGFIGLVAGSLFGIFLKIVEKFTGKKVYTLLLNVDYFPVLKNMEFTEGIEFSFHLIVSIIVTIVFYYALRRFNRHNKMGDYVLLNVLIAVFLYPTTNLSLRTPELFDGIALLYWVFGHVLFGLLIGALIKWVDDQNLEES